MNVATAKSALKPAEPAALSNNRAITDYFGKGQTDWTVRPTPAAALKGKGKATASPVKSKPPTPIVKKEHTHDNDEDEDELDWSSDDSEVFGPGWRDKIPRNYNLTLDQIRALPPLTYHLLWSPPPPHSHRLDTRPSPSPASTPVPGFRPKLPSVLPAFKKKTKDFAPSSSTSTPAAQPRRVSFDSIPSVSSMASPAYSAAEWRAQLNSSDDEEDIKPLAHFLAMPTSSVKRKRPPAPTSTFTSGRPSLPSGVSSLSAASAKKPKLIELSSSPEPAPKKLSALKGMGKQVGGGMRLPAPPAPRLGSIQGGGSGSRGLVLVPPPPELAFGWTGRTGVATTGGRSGVGGSTGGGGGGGAGSGSSGSQMDARLNRYARGGGPLSPVRRPAVPPPPPSRLSPPSRQPQRQDYDPLPRISTLIQPLPVPSHRHASAVALAPPPLLDVRLRAEMGQWMCSACTYVNEQEMWECSICYTPRP